jgi:hypothetical protein
MFSPYRPSFVALFIKQDTRILLFVFRQLNETNQPISDAIKNLQPG